MGKISFNRRKKKLEYDSPPFDQLFNSLELVEKILFSEASVLDFLMKNMTDDTKKSLIRFATLDERLMKRLEEIAASRPAKKAPAGKIDVNEVVDQLIVNISPIFSIVLMTDGTRYVETKPNDIGSLVTFEEFERIHDQSVDTLLTVIAGQRITQLERVLEILKAEPIVISNNLVTMDKGQFFKSVTVYHQSQYAAYLAKIGAGILPDHNEEVESEPNEKIQ